MAGPFWYIGYRFLPTLEGAAVDLTLLIGLFAIYVFVAHALTRFAWTWINLRRVLRALDWHPMVQAFSRLSARFRLSVTEQLYPKGPVDAEYALARLEQRKIVDLDRPEEPDSFIVARSMASHLKDHWWKDSIRAMAPDRVDPAAADDPKTRAFLAAEDSLALHVSLFVRELYVHLFAHLAAVVAGLASLILAVTIYPFQIKRLMLTAAWTVTATTMGVVLWLLVEMERDHVLSRLEGSSPGRIDWSPAFLGKVLARVLLPLIALLASQFPAVRVIVGELLGLISMVVR